MINDHIQALSRVVAVSGDITEDRLGLCAEEENVLAQTVISIFFLDTKCPGEHCVPLRGHRPL